MHQQSRKIALGEFSFLHIILFGNEAEVKCIAEICLFKSRLIKNTAGKIGIGKIAFRKIRPREICAMQNTVVKLRFADVFPVKNRVRNI